MTSNIEAAKWFGIPAIKYSGKVVAALYRDQMVVKLGVKRANHFVDKGEGELFDPSGKGKPMREWVVLACEPDHWFTAVEEAKDFFLDQTAH